MPGRGEVIRPPARFETNGRRAYSEKKTADCSRQVLATGGAIFGSRSIFDPVLGVNGQIFAKLTIFQLCSSIFQ